jgi:hypothetical protein
MRAVDLTPGLEQGHDRVAFPVQQPVQRMPTGRAVVEPPDAPTGDPPAAPDMVEPEQLARSPGRPAVLNGVVDPGRSHADGCRRARSTSCAMSSVIWWSGTASSRSAAVVAGSADGVERDLVDRRAGGRGRGGP